MSSMTHHSRRREATHGQTGAAKLLFVAVPVAMMLVTFVLIRSTPTNKRGGLVTHALRATREDGGGNDVSAIVSLARDRGSSLLKNGIVRLSDGDDPFRTRELRRPYPVFIHIPKTGGTTVENIMRKEYDVKVGRFAFEPLPDDKAGAEEGKYTVRSSPCVLWHNPPKFFVPESFTIVRNPYARIVSEFCYLLTLHNSPWFVKNRVRVHTVYKRIFGNDTWINAMKGGKKTRKKMCNYFASIMVPALKAAVAQEKGLYTEYDCHLLPQSLFFTKAEWVIEQHSFEKVHELLAVYGLERLAVEKKRFSEIPTDHTNASSERCTAYAFDCFTDEVASLIDTLDAETFEYFGYSHDWRSLRRALPDAD